MSGKRFITIERNGKKQAIPVGDRKPYGIERPIAFEDVQKLREEGKKARLVETNRKHKLYAPYEGWYAVAEPQQPEQPQNSKPGDVISPPETVEPISEPAIKEPNPYEERIEQKRQRYQELARKNRADAESKFNQASRMAGAIPLGQPILVGHYSEKADRNYRERVFQTGKKGVELSKKADYYDHKAESTGKAGVSQDDPEAIAKLQQKVNELQKKSDIMKQYNSLMRKGQKKEAVMLLDDELYKDVISYTKYSHSGGLFPSFSLTNNSAKIRQAKERIKMLEQKQSSPHVEIKKSGYEVIENPDINRLQIKFDGIPSETVRKALKSNGFRWSPTNKAWQSYLNNRSKYALTRVEDKIKEESQ